VASLKTELFPYWEFTSCSSHDRLYSVSSTPYNRASMLSAEIFMTLAEQRAEVRRW
jgi:hypothetical protein